MQMQRARIRSLSYAAAAMVLMAVFALWVEAEYRQVLLGQERNDVGGRLAAYENAIRIAFKELTAKLDGLRTHVELQHVGGKITQREFELYAGGLVSTSPWIRTFQFVKDGVIRYSVPLEGNEAIINVNLMKDPRPFIGGDVVRAVVRRAPTITGPTELIQGGRGMIVREPAFATDGELIGLVAAVVDLDRFVDVAGLAHLDPGIRFAITDSARSCFYGTQEVIDADPVERMVQLPDGAWNLHAIPAEGWEAHLAPSLGTFRLTAAAIIFLVAGIVYLLVGRDTVLTDRVRDKTKELSQTVDLLQEDIRQRERIQASLTESEQRNRALLLANPDLIFLLDADGRFLDHKAASEFDTLVPMEQALGRTVAELLPEGFAHDVLSNIRKALATKRLVLHEYQLPVGDDLREFEARYVEAGEQRVMVIIRDITERVRNRRSLIESENRFRTLAETAPVGIWLADPDGSGRYVNPKLKEITGLDESTAVGAGWTDRLHPEDRDGVFDAWMAFIRGRAPFELVYRFVKPDGTVRWVSGRATASKNERGVTLGYVGTMVDVTDQRHSEEILRRSEEQYRRFFEDDLTGDYITRPDGTILSCNPAFVRMFGFRSVEEALQSNAVRLFDDARSREHFLELIRKNGRVEYHRSEYRRADGTSVYTVENAIGMFDADGKLVTIRGYLFDDTRRVLLERQVLQSQKLESVGTLAGGIAHDFNNILAIILGNASLEGGAKDLPPAVVRRFEAIEKASHRGAALVRQLLTFARKTDVRFEPLVVRSAVVEVAQLLSETFPKTVTVHLDLDERPIACIGDATQVHQVLLNLCVNARDAMPNGGTLTLRSFTPSIEEVQAKFRDAPEQPYVGISVADTGTGMDEQVRRRIFEPFFSTKDRSRGTGLGLSLVFGIVQGHNGFIDVVSSPGEGSVFTVYLPMAVSAGVDSAERSADSGLRVGANETILLVEDEELLLDLVATMLRSRGFQVITASDGEMGLQRFREHRHAINIVVSDLDLPKKNGFDLYRALREEDPGVRFIIASGFVDPQKRTLMISAGVLAIIEKPYALDLLLRTVHANLPRVI